MPFIIQQPPTDFPVPVTQKEILATESATGSHASNSVVLDKDIMDRSYLQEKFNSLKQAWFNNVMFESSITKILDDPNFRKIVQMKEEAIPFIIKDIAKEPSILVWALNYITGVTVNPNQRMSITEACKKWVLLFNKG